MDWAVEQYSHTVLVMLAYSFLVWTEWQQRASGQAGASCFLPLGRTNDASHRRPFIGTYSIGCACLPFTDSSARAGLDDYRPDKEVTE